MVSIGNYIKHHQKKEASSAIPVDGNTTQRGVSYDHKWRTEFFLKDQIPDWFAYAGYIIFVIISIITVHLIFSQLKWYFILIIYCIALSLPFATPTNVVSPIGLLPQTIEILQSSSLPPRWVATRMEVWSQAFAAYGVMTSIVSTTSDLMQDVKMGYLTLAAPRAMFCSQIIGTTLGFLFAPIVLWFFYNTYPIGYPGYSYLTPYVELCSGIVLLGAEGAGSLPDHCLTLAILFFFLAICLNVIT